MSEGIHYSSGKTIYLYIYRSQQVKFILWYPGIKNYVNARNRGSIRDTMFFEKDNKDKYMWLQLYKYM